MYARVFSLLCTVISILTVAVITYSLYIPLLGPILHAYYAQLSFLGIPE